MPKSPRLQKVVVTGRFTLPVAILLSAASWMLAGSILAPEAGVGLAEYALWPLFIGLPIPAQLNSALCFVVYIVAGYLLILLNNAYAIIRMRASAQTAVYALLISACPGLHHRLHVGCLVVLMLLLAIHFLFRSYQKEHPESDLLHSFLFIGIGSLLYPQLTWFVPLFWYGAHIFRSLKTTSLLASLIGWAIPYWFLWAYAYWTDDLQLFYLPFRELTTVRPLVSGLTLPFAATLAYLFVLLIGSTVHCLVSEFDDKIRIRCYLQFLILLSHFLLVYVFLQPDPGVLLLPSLLIGVSFLAGHLFVLSDTRGSNIFFICMLVGMAVLFGFNLWWLA